MIVVLLVNSQSFCAELWQVLGFATVRVPLNDYLRRQITSPGCAKPAWGFGFR